MAYSSPWGRFGLVLASALVLIGGCDSPTDGTNSVRSFPIKANLGGTIEIGGAILIIAPNALEQDTVITARLEDAGVTTPELSSVQGNIYDFGPDGTVFRIPADLTIQQLTTPQPTQLPVISWLDRAHKTWADQTSEDRPGRRTGTKVEHFSAYALRFINRGSGGAGGAGGTGAQGGSGNAGNGTGGSGAGGVSNTGGSSVGGASNTGGTGGVTTAGAGGMPTGTGGSGSAGKSGTGAGGAGGRGSAGASGSGGTSTGGVSGGGAGGASAGAGGVGALSVAITSPTTNTVTNGTVGIQVLVSGGTPDNVELLRNSAAFVGALPAPYNYSWNTTGEAEGSYEFVARATRGASTSLSTPIRISVDRTAPEVVSAKPASGATNVWIGDPIQILFSEPVLASSLATGIQVNATPGVVNKTITLMDDRRTATIQLERGKLLGNVLININGVTDLAGNKVATSRLAYTLPEWQLMGSKLSDGSGTSSTFPQIATSGPDAPIVAWTEGVYTRLPNYDLFVKRWNGESWQSLGGVVASALSPLASVVRLHIASNGEPIVGYKDGKGIYLSRFTGGSWVAINAVPLNPAQSTFGLALNAADVPFVLNVEANIGKAYQWGGSAFTQLGSNLNSGSTLVGPLLQFAGATPVAAYIDSYNVTAVINKVVVKRWNGSAWVEPVAGAAISGNAASGVALAVNGANALYSGYLEGNKAYVKRFNSSAWEAVGSVLNVSDADGVYALQLALTNKNATPLAVIQELISGGSNNIFVRQFSGSWQTLDKSLNLDPSLSATSPALAVDSGDVPFVTWSESFSAADTSPVIFVKRRNL